MPPTPTRQINGDKTLVLRDTSSDGGHANSGGAHKLASCLLVRPGSSTAKRVCRCHPSIISRVKEHQELPTPFANASVVVAGSGQGLRASSAQSDIISRVYRYRSRTLDAPIFSTGTVADPPAGFRPPVRRYLRLRVPRTSTRVSSARRPLTGNRAPPITGHVGQSCPDIAAISRKSCPGLSTMGRVLPRHRFRKPQSLGRCRPF